MRNQRSTSDPMCDEQKIKNKQNAKWKIDQHGKANVTLPLLGSCHRDAGERWQREGGRRMGRSPCGVLPSTSLVGNYTVNVIIPYIPNTLLLLNETINIFNCTYIYIYRMRYTDSNTH